MVYAQLLKTTNDSSGNPRRVWQVFRASKVQTHEHAGQRKGYMPPEYYVEGWSGIGALPTFRKGTIVVYLPDVDITPAQYRQLEKRAA